MVNGLIENASILIRDAEKTNNPDALWEHCELMLKKAYDLTMICNKKLSVKDADRTAILEETVKPTIKLIEKILEIAEKCLSGIQNPSGKVSVAYICPKCTEIQEQSGKCPKCDVVLEKQIDYILKMSDKLLKEIKPENADSLMTTCEQMMKKAVAKIKKCSSMRAEDKPLTAEIAQAAKDSIELVKKSVEVSNKYLSLSLEIKKSEQKPTDGKLGTEKPEPKPTDGKSGAEKK
ncbi:MAG: hypothetical protein V1709_10710 [Planctomycetota bacterium]